MGEVQNSVKPSKYRSPIVWPNVIILSVFHILAFHGLYFLYTLQIHWQTFVWTCIVSVIAGLGVVAGAHRLWSHRSFKATLPLRIFLAMGQTMAFQSHIYEWSRDHRVHHKHSDTDTDPYSPGRGLFFSHMGWLFLRKLPQVREAGKNIYLDDLEADPVVVFQRKYYSYLAPLFALVIPSGIPVLCWNEDFCVSLCFAAVFRFIFLLHCSLAINSVGHRWGMRPYDRTINPADNRFLSLIAYGEGSHNYHHVFPWDYKGAELDAISANITTNFIQLMAKVGWAYNLKTASKKLIYMKKLSNGKVLLGTKF